MAFVQPPLNRGPGIYTQEVPSGVHTITGVSTSVTVFVGRFLQGPVGVAYTVTDLTTFQKVFGGVSEDLPVTYAVQDFFENGGTQALVIRLFASAPTSPPSSPPTGVDAGTASASISGLTFFAANPGTWANGMAVGVTQSDPRSAARYAQYGLGTSDLWDVTVYQPNPYGAGMVKVEQHTSLSVKAGPRKMDKWLANNSNYIRVSGVTPTTNVTESSALQASPPYSPPIYAQRLGNGADSAPLAQADYADLRRGYQAVLKHAPIFNILCIPPDTFADDVPAEVLDDAASFCSQNYAFLIVEPPQQWQANAQQGNVSQIDVTVPYGLTGTASEYAAVYFPNPTMADPSEPSPRPISGMVAGLYAKTDATRGVWKAPAGLQTALLGAVGLSAGLDGADRQHLNSNGINALMTIPDVGVVIWGARTMNGADVIGSDFKYVPIRRFTNYLEQSLMLGTQWAVFEPNAEPLWSQLRSTIGSFMQGLFLQGAFAGSTQSDAYFVQCDATTTTPTDQLNGVVNVVVGFAPLRPAEFIVLYITQQTVSSS